MRQFKERQIKSIQSILLLAGSFTFAFLLGEMVHEFGHYVTHLAYGNTGISVHLDPFGGSIIVGASSLPDRVGGISSAAGPIANLTLGIACLLALWRIRRPLLMPLLLWGPVAMLQEGFNLSLGLLSPGSDAQWISVLGLPQPIIFLTGILLLATGIGILAALLPLGDIEGDNVQRQKLLIVLVGMCSLMLLRSVHAFLVSPKATLENLIPLILSIPLAALVVMVHEPACKMAGNINRQAPSAITWPASILALVLGFSMFSIQVLVLNQSF